MEKKKLKPQIEEKKEIGKKGIESKPESQPKTVIEDGKKEKQDKKEIKPRKTEAIVNGKDMSISKKHAIAICNFIRGKNIDKAISELEQVIRLKKPIPMKGEIPHKKGIMSGRYPINASNAFIRLLKSLKSNAIVNELELEKYKISCKANIASRPYRRFGQGRFKRTHVTIKLIPIIKFKKLRKNKEDEK